VWWGLAMHPPWNPLIRRQCQQRPLSCRVTGHQPRHWFPSPPMALPRPPMSPTGSPCPSQLTRRSLSQYIQAMGHHHTRSRQILTEFHLPQWSPATLLLLMSPMVSPLHLWWPQLPSMSPMASPSHPWCPTAPHLHWLALPTARL